jgi:subtilisin family serine protease
MMKKSLYIAGMVLLAVPAVLYLNGHLQEDLTSLINEEIEQAPPAAGPVTLNWRAGQILVKPKAGLTDDEFDKILKGNQGKRLEKIGSLPVHVISVPEKAEEAVVRALSKNPHIEFAELDMISPLTTTTVNDPQFASAWHLPKMQTPTAWDVSKGTGITIAILDSGVDGTHPDLVNQMVPGWNAIDNSSTTADINGHGTAVAGTAAAATNNATGVASIAGGAKIMPVRITNDPTGYAYWSDVARGLNWAADNGADVANISYGVSNSTTVASAAQYMRNKGGVVVVSAANDGVDPGYTDNPYMISVSATDSADAKASWSNYGAFIDVAAPGVSILTTTRGGGYGNWNGTSFSSPATAGVVALIMSANPSLTPDDIEKVLENSAVKVAGTDFHPYFGYGRVDAAAAVQLALNTTAKDTTPPTVNIFTPAGGSTASGLVSVDVNANDNVAVSQVTLSANGKVVGSDGTAPYQFSWDTTSVVDGNVVLSATAVDGTGNQGVSSNVTVTVKNQTTPLVTDNAAPTVSISKPVNGAKVTGTVTIAISANDDVAISKVSLSIDGKLVSATTAKTISYSWNTRKVAAGSHSIQAIATDTSNKTSTMTIQVTK